MRERLEIFHMITNLPNRIDTASFRLANHVQTCRKIMGISFPGPFEIKSYGRYSLPE